VVAASLKKNAAAHVAHGFENISADFCVWVMFYGPEK